VTGGCFFPQILFPASTGPAGLGQAQNVLMLTGAMVNAAMLVTSGVSGADGDHKAGSG